MNKKICALVLAFILAVGMYSGFVGEAESVRKNYGLTVSSDGTIMMDGKPFYGYGINGYMICMSLFQDPFYDYAEAFATMKKYNVAFIRLALSGGSSADFALYQNDPETYFAVIDKVVAEAEKQQVGIIADITWGYSFVGGLFGEQAYKIGDPSSRSYKFAMQYTEDVVKRYKDSPAIFGWEISNELNLICDLYGDAGWTPTMFSDNAIAKPNGFDHVTGREIQTFMKGTGEAIRRQDSYRLISNGNGIVRGNAKNLLMASDKMDADHTWKVSWTADTLAEFYEMNAFFAPDPVDTMSMHIGNGYYYPADKGYSNDTIDAWGKKVSYLDYLKAYVEAAKKEKKALYFGEFGDLGDMFFEKENFSQSKQKIREVMDAINTAGIQLASVWQFAFDETSTRRVRDDGGLYSYSLSQIQKENQAFQGAGRQDVKAYWEKAVPAIYMTPAPTTSSAPDTDSTTQTGQTDPDGVSRYMLSSSTKLRIDAAADTIHIAEALSLNIFKRSIALKEGYALKVYGLDGAELSADDVMISGGFAAAVFDPDGRELRRFAVSVDKREETSPIAPPQKGFPVWGWILIAAGILLVLGGGVAGYWFLWRPRHTNGAD